MFDMAEIFSSKARISILRVLSCQAEPLKLRHIAVLANYPIYSIQRALNQLKKEKLIHKKKERQYRLYSLNQGHPHYSFIGALFELETKNRILWNSQRYEQKATSALEFANSALRLFKGADTWT